MSGNHILETILIYGTVAAILGGIGWLLSFILSGGKLRGELIAKALEEALANPKDLEEYWKGMELQANMIHDSPEKQAAFDHVTNLRDRFQMIRKNAEGFKKLNRQEKAIFGDLINNANGLEEKLSKITDPILRGEKQIEIKKVNDELARLISAIPPELPKMPNLNNEPTALSSGITDDDLRYEMNLLKVKAVSSRDAALRAVDELVVMDPEFEKELAFQEIEIRYQNEVEKIERNATITILKKRRDSDIKRAQENSKVASLSEEQTAGNLARINKRYEDQIAKFESNY